MASKKPSPLQVTAARRAEKIYMNNSEDERYRANMFGNGKKRATGTIGPMQKLANARSIAQDADRADYVAEMKKRKK